MVVLELLCHAGYLCYVRFEGEARRHIPLFLQATALSPNINIPSTKWDYRTIGITVLGMESFISFDPVMILRDYGIPFRIRRSRLNNVAWRRNNSFNNPILGIHRRSILNPHNRLRNTLIRRYLLVWV